MRFAIPLGADERVTINSAVTAMSSVAISLDGRSVAYAATTAGVSQIYLRSVETGEVRALPGTRNALAPFFSPDGQWLGFGNVSGMSKVSVGGGAVLPLTTFGANGAFWGADGVITTATPTGLQRMPETGGTLSPLTYL
jgi:serine/threonine-protein kinase